MSTWKEAVVFHIQMEDACPKSPESHDGDDDLSDTLMDLFAGSNVGFCRNVL